MPVLPPKKSSNSDLVKIGQAAQILGVSIDTIRRWEAKGKIVSVRTPGGTRVYSKNYLQSIAPVKTVETPEPEDFDISHLPFTESKAVEVLNTAPNPLEYKKTAVEILPAQENQDQELKAQSDQPTPIQTSYFHIVTLAVALFLLAAALSLGGSRIKFNSSDKLVSLGKPIQAETGSNLALGQVLAASNPSIAYLQINTDASISGSLRIATSLTVPKIDGDTTINGNTTNNGNLTISGPTNTLAVEGSANIGGNLSLGSVKTTFYTGNGVPADSLGKNGDYYYRGDSPTSSTSVYYKLSGSWVAVGSQIQSLTLQADSGTGNIQLDQTLKVLGAGINTTSYSNGTVTITGTEADTLDTVTSRGASTSNALTLDSGSNVISAGTLTATGGTIDGIVIGGTTAAAASFTTLSASSSVSLTGLANSSGTELCLNGSDQVVTCASGSSSATLQSAYDNGNTITTTVARDLAITLGSGLSTSFTIANAGTGSGIIINDTNTGSVNTAFEVKSNGTSNLTINENGQLSTSSNILTTGSGSITSAGLLTGSAGITVSGGTANINVSGTSSTAIGNSTGTFSVTSNGFNVTTGGALSGVNSLDTITTSPTGLTFQGTGSIGAGSGSNLNLDAGAGGGIVNIASNSTGDINIGGGSSSTGCTVTNANGNLACTGNITGSSAGTVGYWTRSGTTISPATSGDTISTSGDITTTGSGALTIAGVTSLNGNLNLGDATSDTITFTSRLASGSSIIPAFDLGSDLGSVTNRFNNLYVNTINSNSTLTTAGQAIFTYSPTDTTYSQSTVMINPTTAPANSNLLGIGLAGAQRAGIDAEGDLNLGYNGGAGTSVPTSANPFNVYNHGTTNVAYIDTSGNANFNGTGTFGTGLTLTTGALNLTATSGALTLSGLSASSISTGANALTFTSSNFNTTSTGINNTAIGASTPSTGSFTTLAASSTVTLSGLSAGSGASICLDGSNHLGTCASGSSSGTLQSDYNNGNSITTTTGRNIAFTLASGLGAPTSFTLTNNGTADAFDITNANSSGTVTNGFLVNQTGAGTLTNAINVTQTSGTVTNGLTFSGTFTNIINSPVFTVVGGASVVNGFTFTPATTNNAPTFAAGGSGSDSNVGLNINSKGTGTIALSSANASGTTTTSAFTLTDNSLTSGTGAYFTSSSLTTGKLVDISNTSNTQTTGTLLNISSTATSLTSGNLLALDWSPGSSTTATGDLFSINIGANALTTGNLLNIKNNGSSLFSVNPTQITASIPTAFTAPGDVSIAYDINFTNPIASFIKSQAALTLQAGDSYSSSDLSLNTFNEGNVVVNSNAITSNAFNVQAPAITTGNAQLIQANALTTGSALNISSTSTAGGASGASYLINLSRSGANASASHTAYGLASSVTDSGTTSTNIAGDFTATGATTNYGVKVEAMTGATSTGIDIGALSGTTANKGINIGAISGSGATGAGISIGNISTTGTTNYGLQLGTLTGASTSNYQIQTGNITAVASATNAGLVIGTTKAVTGTAASSTNYGININPIDSTGTLNAALNIQAVSGAGTNDLIKTPGFILDASSNITGAGTIASAAHTITSTSANSLTVGANGTTNPVLNIDDSTSSVATGLNIKGAAAGAGIALSALSSGTDENLTLDAKGAGTISIGATSTGNVLLAGGSGATGCTVTNSSGDLTCTGNISGASTGTAGYWTRSGTILSPATAGDAITTSGNISTSGFGTITSAGLLTGSAGITATTGNVAITAGALTLNGTTRISNAGVGTFITGTVIGSQTFTTNNIADSGALTIKSGGTSALTLDTTGAGAVNIANTNSNALALGNSSATFALTSSGGLNVSTGGALTGVASLDSITTSSTALTFTSTAPTISVSTAATNIILDAGTSGKVQIANGSTGDVEIAGGSGSTGCTITNSTGALACSGNITGPTTGTIGYWTRSGTTLSPATSNDIASISSNSSTALLTLAPTGATGTGLAISALSGATANTGINIGAISGTGTGRGVTVGNISSTGATNIGLNLGTLTGGSSSNTQIQTGNITAVASATNAGLVIGTTKAVTGTAASSTNYGIKVNPIDSTGDNNYGLFVGAVSGATNNYGLIVDGSGYNGFGTSTPGYQFDFEGSQPASVGTDTGSNNVTTFNLYGGTGGDTTIATEGTGGLGGSLNFAAGNGGQASAALTTAIGGNGGTVAFFSGGGGGANTGATSQSGNGGEFDLGGSTAGLASGTGTNIGGIGGPVVITSGGGGQAQNGTSNTGGDGGELRLAAGTGGQAIAGTATGGNGGNLVLYAGKGGAGDTNNGTGGYISFSTASTTALTEVMRITNDGSVDIGGSGHNAAFEIANNGAASLPAGLISGTWFTGGSSTTTKPQLLLQPSGTTSNAWSTSGTGLGINSAQTFAGNLLDIQQASKSVFKVAGVSTAVNGFTFSTAAASSGVSLAATGDDSNIALSIDAKGSGALNLNNTGTGDILIGGGSGSTGCTVTNSNGNLTCTGNITGSASGTLGYWSRSATTLSPATSNDIASISSNSSTALLTLAPTGATGTGLAISALSGTTANTGINIGAISGSGATGTGITIGNISTTGTTNYGLQLGTLTGASTSNYQIQTGNITAVASATNAGLVIGTTKAVTGTAASSTNYGININPIDSTGTLNAALNIQAVSGAGTNDLIKTPGFILDASSNITGAGTIASAAHTITSTSANSLTVGANGTTNPVLNIDDSTSSVATGLNIKGAAAGAGIALSALSSGTDENLTLDAKGAGTISIGATSTGNVLLAGGSGATGCTITNSTGALACAAGMTAITGNVAITAGALTLNGTTRISNAGAGTFTTGTVIGSQTFTTNNIADSGALNIAAGGTSALALDAGTSGAVNIAGSSTGDINIGGGSSSTGCTITNSTGALACSGNITGPTTGNVGYWTRSGTTLSPLNSGDAITTSGNISTSGSGTITSAGLLTGSAGLTVSGGAVSLNASSNNNTSINTGNSTGSVSIGNSLAGAIALSTASTFGVTTTTSSQTFTSAVASTSTTSSAFVFTDNSLNTGTGLYLSSSSLTTGNLAQIDTGSANTWTTGSLLKLTSTATSLTSGSLLALDWSPGSSTTSTGDLFSINIGANALTTGNIFNIKNNGSSLFAVNPTQIVASVPTAFNAPGDVAIAYDINFTNPTASFIKSQAPLYLQSGEAANSSDLTLKTFNEGSVVVDSAAITSNSLNIQSPAVTTGNGLLLQANALTTGNAASITSSSTAGGASGSSYLLNLSRSGANASSSHTAYGLASSVTDSGTTSINIAGDFTATGATTNYGVKVEAMTGATSTGLDIGALSGTTANKGINIGAISGSGATGAGLTVGAISTTGTANAGISLSTLTGGTSTNYQVSTGAVTAIASATNAQLNLGGVTGTAASSTNYGINIGNLDSTGTSNTGLNLGTFSGATTSTGIAIGALSSATSKGITIGALSGTTADVGLTIGAISGSGATGTGITVGNISTTGTTNYGLQLGTLTGGSTSNYQIQTGNVTAVASATNAGLVIGTTKAVTGTAASSTNYGININAIDSTGTNNYGLYVAAVSGATNNYAAIFAGGKVGIGTATPADSLDVEGGNIRIGQQTNATTALAKVSQSTAGTIAGSGTASIDGITAMAVYNGNLFVGTSKSNAAEVYRYDGGTTWTRVSQSTAGTIAAAGTANIDGVTAMTVYNGKLYIGTKETDAAEVYEYGGSTTWTKISQSTAGTIAGSGTASIDQVSAIAVYAGRLYIGTTETGKAEVYRWNGGTSWSQNNAGNAAGTFKTTVSMDAVTSMAVVEGALGNSGMYISAKKGTGAGEVYYYQSQTTWGTYFSSAGALAGAGSDDSWVLASYNGKLYAGSTKSNAAELFRADGVTNAGPSWRDLTSTAGTFASGGTANIDAISAMTVYNNKLYFATSESNSSEIYQYNESDAATTTATLVSTATPGTIAAAGTASIDTVQALQPYNGTLYAGTNESASAEVYSYTNVNDQSYALKFHAGSSGAGNEPTSLTNDGSISFLAGSSASNNTGNVTEGTFLFTNSITTGNGAYDVAEDYPTRDSTLQPGDLISTDPLESDIVAKTSQSYDHTLLGVYSQKPGLRLSQQGGLIDGTHAVPVALVGRVPVKVNLENGPIVKGDFLTSSSTPGQAMKATHPGQVIGKALEDFAGTTDGSTFGKINAYLNVSFADPTNALASLTVDDQGNLVVPSIKTDKLILPDTQTSQSVQSYSLDASKLTGIGSLASSQSSYNVVTQDLATVITAINDQFNTVAGQLKAQQDQLAQTQANIAQVQNQNNVLAEQVASQSAQLAETQESIASLSAQLGEASSSASSSALATNLTDPTILFASDSANLAKLNVSDTISTYHLKASDLTSLGDTSLGQTAVNGDLTVDGTFSVTGGNTINSLGTLFLQSSPLANLVDFFNGAATIDKYGNLTAQTVSANQFKGAKGLVTGSGKILRGQSSVFINNIKTALTSRILITPTSQTSLILSVTNKQTAQGFSVSISSPTPQDVSFDWFVVDEE